MSKADKGRDEPDEPAVPSASEAETRSPAKAETGQGDVQSYIGARLRRAFDDIASQPVPDRFLELMRQLDKT